MIQRRQHVRFALEPRHALGVTGQRLRQNFDGDIAAEPGIVSAVDLAHAASADGREDFVGAQSSTGGQLHEGQTILSHAASGKGRRQRIPAKSA